MTAFRTPLFAIQPTERVSQTNTRSIPHPVAHRPELIAEDVVAQQEGDGPASRIVCDAGREVRAVRLPGDLCCRIGGAHHLDCLS